ncbi:LY75 protein, partial [Polypterus senegalus]
MLAAGSHLRDTTLLEQRNRTPPATTCSILRPKMMERRLMRRMRHSCGLVQIYTSKGNSFGLPCEFPFKYNGTWHDDCVSDEREGGLPWCSTSEDYDIDQQWGLCLKPGK